MVGAVSPMSTSSEPYRRNVRHRHGRRAAAVYLLTLSISMLLAGVGFTLIAIQRADRRLQQNVARTDELKWYAQAGIEMALALMEQTPGWRASVTGNDLFRDFPIGDGQVSVQVFDDTDGQIANNDADPVRIRAIAARDGSLLRLEARLRPRPHPALRYALFGTGTNPLEFEDRAVIRGPVRSHGPILADPGNLVQDDASFETLTGDSIEQPLSPRSFATAAMAAPQPDLAFYQSRATVISGRSGSRCELKGFNLTPTSNPGGQANPHGIYWLRAGGREVLIEDMHLRGTLIITETGTNRVTFRGGLWVEPGPLQYPVLLVDCPWNTLRFDLDSSMTEAAITINLLIFGIGLGGVDMNEDGDKWDTIFTHVRGLVWSNATGVYLENQRWPFTGCLINGRITVRDDVVVDNDLTLLNAPSPGFVESGMSIEPGSIREVGP